MTILHHKLRIGISKERGKRYACVGGYVIRGGVGGVEVFVNERFGDGQQLVQKCLGSLLDGNELVDKPVWWW